jgi:hypothetical protein
MTTSIEAQNRQIVADCFRGLVRYGLLKTHRNVEKLGASAACFTPQAMAESLVSSANAAIFGGREPSVAVLMERAHDPTLTFCFTWKAPDAKVPYEAGFGLEYEDDDLKVRLLWLDLPERVPISPRLEPVEGRRPLQEAVIELLRVFDDSRMAPYPPPE